MTLRYSLSRARVLSTELLLMILPVANSAPLRLTHLTESPRSRRLRNTRARRVTYSVLSAASHMEVYRSLNKIG